MAKPTRRVYISDETRTIGVNSRYGGTGSRTTENLDEPKAKSTSVSAGSRRRDKHAVIGRRIWEFFQRSHQKNIYLIQVQISGSGAVRSRAGLSYSGGGYMAHRAG
jgi:hypothetical protein